jgi:hypothetical protein
MSTASPVFAQVMAALHPQEFTRCVARFPPPRRPRGLSAYDHFLALCFAHLTGREGLRDLEVCLNARPARAYQAGFRTRITRTNLAYANEHRDWRILAEVAQVLMRRTRRLYTLAQPDPELPQLSYALDSSLIDLSLTLFPWGEWQHTAAAVKLHALLNLRDRVPVWTAVTEACCADQKTLSEIPVEKGAFYVLDRGYLDFARLSALDGAGAFFVVRSKAHVNCRVTAQRPVDESLGLRTDQTVALQTRWSRRRLKAPLRRIEAYNEEHQFTVVLLTNNFELPAQTLSLLYRRRWQVELFFRWIKQHLRLRHFLGRSPNAVRSQVWAAVCAYLLVAIAKKQWALPHNLHQIFQVVSVSAFEPVPLPELFSTHKPLLPDHSQLLLLP